MAIEFLKWLISEYSLQTIPKLTRITEYLRHNWSSNRKRWIQDKIKMIKKYNLCKNKTKKLKKTILNKQKIKLTKEKKRKKITLK